MLGYAPLQRKNMFVTDIIKDYSDSLEKTRVGVDIMMGLFMLLLKPSAACSSLINSPASIQHAVTHLFRRLPLTVWGLMFPALSSFLTVVA